MHEASLHVHAQQHTEPHHVDAHFLGNGAKHGQDDEGDFKEVQEERQEEDEDVDHHEEANLTTWQTSQQMLHPLGAVHTLEHHREHAWANQEEHHHGREAHGAVHGIPNQVFVQTVMDRSQDQCAYATHGTGFGGGGNGRVDTGQAAHGAQHREDQESRGDDAAQALHPQVKTIGRARFFRNAWHVLRFDDAQAKGVEREDTNLQDGWTPSTFVHIAHRAAELVSHHHQHE